MNSDDTAMESPLDFERLMPDAVKQILRDEDPQRFLGWIQAHLPEYDTGLATELVPSKEMYVALSAAIGRAIWGATPLPGNGFKPNPLPAPGRNDMCFCGSGRKFKHCCANAPAPLSLDAEDMWPVVAEQLPKKVLAQAIKEQRIPVTTLMLLADDYLQGGQPRKGVKLLEPLFEAPIKKTDERYDYALNTLCNLYDACHFRKKKTDLLYRITGTVPRSPLRAGAWQRLACISIDAGDSESAWEAFRHAQRDDPDNEGIALLEVQLLIGENQPERAQERAQFWIKRLQRSGAAPDDPQLGFLMAVAKNPMQAMNAIGMEVSSDEGQALQGWLEQVANRPVPTYETVDDCDEGAGQEDPENVLRKRLQSMGVPSEQIDEALKEFALEQHEEESDDEDEVPAEPLDSLMLSPPRVLLEVENEWHDIFPLDKPFSVNDEPFECIDVWHPDIERVWMAFLEKHPEAFDSIDILDDLATALNLHDQANTPWLDNLLLGPILARCAAITQHALKNSDAPPRLNWLLMENRPALRNLARLGWLYQRGDQETMAMAIFRYLLTLNPGDNHGFRTVVINELLRQNDNESAVTLAGQYPDDIHADIAYGRALALYRLKDEKEARLALDTAMDRLPKVVRYLIRKRIRQPKLSAQGISIGGDDQAWIYREDMRDVWEETPGALAWLKAAATQMDVETK